MRYLLDTNTCIAAMRNHPEVVRRMSAVVPGDCVVSAITAYELYTGVAKCANPAREKSKVECLGIVGQLGFDDDAAQRAATVRAHLEVIGLPIGPYDTLLAGHALCWSLILVTANTKEFARVPGLMIENWQVA